MITKELILSKGFIEKESSFKLHLKRSRKDSPKEISISFNNKLNSFYLEGEATKKPLSIERLDSVIKGIELLNGKSINNLISKEI